MRITTETSLCRASYPRLIPAGTDSLSDHHLPARTLPEPSFTTQGPPPANIILRVPHPLLSSSRDPSSDLAPFRPSPLLSDLPRSRCSRPLPSSLLDPVPRPRDSGTPHTHTHILSLSPRPRPGHSTPGALAGGGRTLGNGGVDGERRRHRLPPGQHQNSAGQRRRQLFPAGAHRGRAEERAVPTRAGGCGPRPRPAPRRRGWAVLRIWARAPKVARLKPRDQDRRSHRSGQGLTLQQKPGRRREEGATRS